MSSLFDFPDKAINQQRNGRERGERAKWHQIQIRQQNNIDKNQQIVQCQKAKTQTAPKQQPFSL
jgi:hypothetical protein